MKVMMMKKNMLRWPTPSGFPPLITTILGVILAIILYLTAPIIEFDIIRILTSHKKLAEFLAQLLVLPDWQYVPQLLSKMLETIEITILATLIATLLSIPIGFLAAENASPHPIIYRLVRDLLSFIRALPELVWALVFVSAVGLGPLPGVMALAFVTIGFMGKFFAEAIEVVDPKAVEGVSAHGASWFQVRMFAMFPQALPDFFGITMYVLDHNLRAATILGLVGAGGIGYDLIMSMRLFQYDRLLMIVIAIYLVVTSLDRISNKIRSQIIHGL